MVIFTMVNGSKESKMAKEYSIRSLQKSPTKDNGRMAKKMVLDS